MIPRSLLLLGLLGLGGCVFTTGGGAPITGAAQPATAKNPGDIVVMEGAPPAGRYYQVIGTVNVSARSFNLLSSAPTRADVDEALRAEAAKLGGDAVTMVRYRSEGAGLASRAILRGEGSVIAWR